MENVESNLNNLQINSRSEENDEKWGWPLRELYRQGLSFYKGDNFEPKKMVQFSIFIISNKMSHLISIQLSFCSLSFF